MALKFCPKCKTLMSPHKINDEFFMKCDGCGFIDKLNHSLSVNEKLKMKEIKGEGIASNENILATYEHACKKCGYDKVQILDLGIFVSDEDNLIMLKCGGCGWCERVGRRTS